MRHLKNHDEMYEVKSTGIPGKQPRHFWVPDGTLTREILPISEGN